MRTLSKSVTATVILGHLGGKAGVAATAHKALELRLAELLGRRVNASNLEDLGRWTHREVRALLSQFRLPEGVIVRNIVATFYSEPNARGTVVMKVDCRTGKIEIF